MRLCLHRRVTAFPLVQLLAGYICAVIGSVNAAVTGILRLGQLSSSRSRASSRSRYRILVVHEYNKVCVS